VSCFFVVVVPSYSRSSLFLEQLFLPPIGRRVTGRGPWTCPFDHSCARDSHPCHEASLRKLDCRHLALFPLQSLPIMSLLNSPKCLFTSLLVVVATVTIAVYIPCPVSAMPITPVEPTPSSQPQSPDMNDKVTFDIVFGLGLFTLTIVAFVFVASSKSFTWFNSVIDRGFLSSYGSHGLHTTCFVIRRNVHRLRHSEASPIAVPSVHILLTSQQRHRRHQQCQRPIYA
jgi:hypothetical protein